MENLLFCPRVRRAAGRYLMVNPKENGIDSRLGSDSADMRLTGTEALRRASGPRRGNVSNLPPLSLASSSADPTDRVPVVGKAPNSPRKRLIARNARARVWVQPVGNAGSRVRVLGAITAHGATTTLHLKQQTVPGFSRAVGINGNALASPASLNQHTTREKGPVTNRFDWSAYDVGVGRQGTYDDFGITFGPVSKRFDCYLP